MLDGNVRWILGFGNGPRCEVLGYGVVAGGNDIFGDLGDAYLELRGPLRRIHEVKLRRLDKTLKYKPFVSSVKTSNEFITSYEVDHTVYRNIGERIPHSKIIRLVIKSRFTFQLDDALLELEDRSGSAYTTSDRL